MIDFNFYTSLSARNKLKFVDSVVGTLVDESGYKSVIRDLIFDYMIIKVFTDVDTSVVDNEENSNYLIDRIEDFLNETNIVEIVKQNVDNDLIDELNKAVNDNIAYLTGIHRNYLTDSLIDLIDVIKKQINEIDVKSLSEFAELIKNTQEEFTPERLIDAYANSELYKNNIAGVR